MLRSSISHLLQVAAQNSASKGTLSTSLTLPPIRNYIPGFPALPEKKTHPSTQNLKAAETDNTTTTPADKSYPHKIFSPPKKDVETSISEIENNKLFSNRK